MGELKRGPQVYGKVTRNAPEIWSQEGKTADGVCTLIGNRA